MTKPLYKYLRRLIAVCAAVVLLFHSAAAQLDAQFGKNKVHYKDFSWKTLNTPHFTIYFYRSEEPLAYRAERMAERAYNYLSATLRHEFEESIPLIIYASSDDFQQTEVVEGMLGEGIGGVTESLRGRIVIPFLGSYRSFNHVLIHELTHAFQLDMLSEGQGAFGLASAGFQVPLWFMEGMAEYLSEYSNPLTTMWLRDAVIQETLPNVKEIERIRDIRAYRFGESLWAYIVEQHGQQIIGDLLREIPKAESWNKSIRTLANITWKKMYANWLDEVTSRYNPETAQGLPIDAQAHRLISHEPEKFYLNIVPAISPDGYYLAFISDRDFYQTIYLASAQTGEILKTLVEGERRGTYESLRFLNAAITWSPDSRQIAFTAKAGGENAIYLMDVPSREITKKLTPPLTSLSFPAWSPDGRKIAFTGVQQGQEDLYLIDIETEILTQLSDDLYSNRHAAWAPDGQRIAFTTDAGEFSNPEQLKFGPANLVIYDLQTQESTLLTNTAYNDFTPVWSPDGTMLAFVSDRNGQCNIYLLDLQQWDGNSAFSPHVGFQAPHIIPLTNANTGVVGLTLDNPALTWAAQQGRLAFSGFSEKGWNIWTLENPAQTYHAYLEEVGFDEEALKVQPARSAVETVALKDWSVELPDPTTTDAEDYNADLKPDYILGGGGGSDKDFLILARLSFSDILANHRLRIGMNLTSVFDESDFLVAYVNQARRLSYGVAAYQSGGNLGTYSMKDARLDLEVQRGLGVQFTWPFDKFERLEFGLEGWMISGELLGEDEDAPPQEMEDQFFAAADIAYVHDTTLYTGIGPLDGQRWRVSLYPAVGDFTYVSLIADYRRYLHVTRRSALAFRAIAAGSFGENARIFEPSGPFGFRGREYGDDDDIAGTKFLLSNLEYRFPLIPDINLLRGAVFWDMAMGWTDDVQPFTRENAALFRCEDVKAAYGLGIRVPFRSPFGVLTVRIDVVQETDLTRNIGNNRVVFSIGSEF